MMMQTVLEELEAMIDDQGLRGLVENMAAICEARAGAMIEMALDGDDCAADWLRASNLFDRVAERLEI